MILSDTDKKLSSRLGVLSPTTLYARRWTYIIDDGGIIRHIDRNVDPDTSGRVLIERLASLKVPPRRAK